VTCEGKFAFFFILMRLLKREPEGYKLAMSRDRKPGTMRAEEHLG
jgi:hypothetical protein